MTDDEAMRALCQRFFDAIERADVATVAEIYADDAVIWHSAENAMSTKDGNLARLAHSTATWPGRRYEDRDVRTFPGGFVQRHRLVREQAGETLEAFACILCDVRDGRITRLYEYFDQAQMTAWRRLD